MPNYHSKPIDPDTMKSEKDGDKDNRIRELEDQKRVSDATIAMLGQDLNTKNHELTKATVKLRSIEKLLEENGISISFEPDRHPIISRSNPVHDKEDEIKQLTANLDKANNSIEKITREKDLLSTKLEEEKNKEKNLYREIKILRDKLRKEKEKSKDVYEHLRKKGEVCDNSCALCCLVWICCEKLKKYPCARHLEKIVTDYAKSKSEERKSDNAKLNVESAKSNLKNANYISTSLTFTRKNVEQNLANAEQNLKKATLNLENVKSNLEIANLNLEIAKFNFEYAALLDPARENPIFENSDRDYKKAKQNCESAAWEITNDDLDCVAFMNILVKCGIACELASLNAHDKERNSRNKEIDEAWEMLLLKNAQGLGPHIIGLDTSHAERKGHCVVCYKDQKMEEGWLTHYDPQRETPLKDGDKNAFRIFVGKYQRVRIYQIDFKLLKQVIDKHKLHTTCCTSEPRAGVEHSRSQTTSGSSRLVPLESELASRDSQPESGSVSGKLRPASPHDEPVPCVRQSVFPNVESGVSSDQQPVSHDGGESVHSSCTEDDSVNTEPVSDQNDEEGDDIFPLSEFNTISLQ